jgi:hypothetical protein
VPFPVQTGAFQLWPGRPFRIALNPDQNRQNPFNFTGPSTLEQIFCEFDQMGNEGKIE